MSFNECGEALGCGGGVGTEEPWVQLTALKLRVYIKCRCSVRIADDTLEEVEKQFCVRLVGRTAFTFRALYRYLSDGIYLLLPGVIVLFLCHCILEPVSVPTEYCWLSTFRLETEIWRRKTFSAGHCSMVLSLPASVSFSHV